MFTILPDIWLVISCKVVLVVCGRKIKNSWLNPFFLSKFKITLWKSIGYINLISRNVQINPSLLILKLKLILRVLELM